MPTIVKRVCLFVWLIGALASPSTAAEGLKTPPPVPRPIEVTVGTYLIDFQQIDEATLTHTIVGYLTLEWRDPRLAKGQAPDLDRSAVTLDQIWSPNIEFTNQHEPRAVSNSDLAIGDDGRVTYQERFMVQLSTDFVLQRYPFDQQMLLMRVESFRYDTSDLVLKARDAKQLKSPDAFLTDWYILDVNERIDVDYYNPDAQPYSRYTFDIHVQRKVGYYIWNVFLPLSFITLLAWAVFFINPEDVQTRTGVLITALLTAIAFSLVITGSRPRVSYLTFMDAVFLNSYFLIFLAITSVIAAHYTIRRSGSTDAAERLSRYGRIGFPPLLLVTNSLIVARFFF